MNVQQWFEDMLFGLRELWLNAIDTEQIIMAVDATLEIWRLQSEAGL